MGFPNKWKMKAELWFRHIWAWNGLSLVRWGEGLADADCGSSYWGCWFHKHFPKWNSTDGAYLLLSNGGGVGRILLSRFRQKIRALSKEVDCSISIEICLSVSNRYEICVIKWLEIGKDLNAAESEPDNFFINKYLKIWIYYEGLDFYAIQQNGVGIKLMDSETRLPGFQSRLLHFLTTWSWQITSTMWASRSSVKWG